MGGGERKSVQKEKREEGTWMFLSFLRRLLCWSSIITNDEIDTSSLKILQKLCLKMLKQLEADHEAGSEGVQDVLYSMEKWLRVMSSRAEREKQEVEGEEEGH